MARVFLGRRRKVVGHLRISFRLDLSGRVAELTNEAGRTWAEAQERRADLTVRQVVAQFLGQSRTDLILGGKMSESWEKRTQKKKLLYLSVEEAVEKGDKETLERREEVGSVGPNGEFSGRSMQRSLDHHQHVGDAQQRQQHHGRLHGFPAIQLQVSISKDPFFFFDLLKL